MEEEESKNGKATGVIARRQMTKEKYEEIHNDQKLSERRGPRKLMHGSDKSEHVMSQLRALLCRIGPLLLQATR